MKIAFVGKGGSGKTTLSALFSRFVASEGFPTLAIDADINQHLGHALGVPGGSASLPPMGIEIKRIKEYLRGTNPLLTPESMIKTTPPGRGSNLIKLQEENALFKYFARDIDGVKLMAVGPFSEEDLGVSCYHSKTGSVELVLNHLKDTESEYVIVDMTAGADSFSSGLFTRFDVTILVVEPTLKSTSVYEQYSHYAKEHGVSIKAVGNKVEGDEDRRFLEKQLGMDLIAVLSTSPFVKRLDKGEILPFSKFEDTNRVTLRKIKQVIDQHTKDWRRFYQQAVEFHLKNARSWANAASGKDLTTQVDPKFDPNVLAM